MEKKQRRPSPLAEVEKEVLGMGREWMREQYQKKLQKLADVEGKISPPEQSKDHQLPSLPDRIEDLCGGSGG